MRKLLALLACVFLPAAVVAQTTESNPHDAQPERPSVATHAWTVAPRWIEIEAGTEFDRYDDHAHGETAPLVAKIGSDAPHATRTADTNRSLTRSPRRCRRSPRRREVARDRARAGRCNPRRLPEHQISNRLDGIGVGTGTTDTGIVLISSREFGGVSLDLNAGFTHRIGKGDLAPHNSSVWAVSFGGPAYGPLGWVGELFGYPPTSGPGGDRAVVAALCGPTMKVRRWLLFDAGVIVPIEGPQAKAIYVGAVYNIGHLGHAH